MFDSTTIGYRRLAAQIITTAWEDAQEGDVDAREFLRSEWTQDVTELLGMNYDRIAAAVDALPALQRAA